VWKIAILLLWLCIPLGGYMLYRADYARYQHDCATQRRECAMRADMIQRYAVYFERQARQVPALEDKYSMQHWTWEWDTLQTALEMERKALRSTPLSYFPRAGAALESAEQALSEQQKATEQAAKQRGYAIDIKRSLADLEQSIYEVRATADYYRRAGSDTIYMYLQEQLAQYEDAYYSRVREHDMFLDNSATRLTDASRASREAQRSSAELPEQLKLDETRTYQQELRQRFANFNLGQQLGLLLSDLV
jgi:hypothetical protein